MFKQNKSLLVIAVIAVVNALGYGIIIPILYSYSLKFGLSDFQNGLLFSIFSIFQFLATPIIGRLSDKHGRRPLLLISLSGTAVSFLMMAAAPNALFLFIARALDGITAGNIPVASAVISDTTAAKDRAKGFGIIGASFGFGFIFGPAISAVTFRFGSFVPFVVAAGFAMVAIAMTYFILPETNNYQKEVAKGKFLDFGKLIKAVFDENVGLTLLISLIYSLAFGLFIYAFQPFSIKILHLSATQISAIFTVFGIIGLLAQIVIIPRVTKMLGDRKTLTIALTGVIFTFMGLFLVRSFYPFVVIAMFHSLANGFVNPMIQTLLSKEADENSQGSIMGLNASYMSIGLILGPIIGGTFATLFIPLPFFIGSVIAFASTLISLQILKKPHTIKAKAF